MSAWAGPAEQVVHFDIASQSLSDGLMEFSRQSDITLLANAELVRGKQAPAVKGEIESGQALSLLLAHSGLSYRYQSDDTIAIVAQDNSAEGGTGQAQTAAGGDVAEVVVTGFRESLDKALDIKRSSAGVVDAIVAEDIAKFPDTNLAESLQRVPGVAISRERGEGRQISVRGLGADFTRVRINGLEAQAASEGNTTRGFDFNVFASELFNQITVRKTASADVDEGSLGATVDLRTAQPFDYPGFKVALSGQESYNDLSEKTSPRLAFLISNTFADGRLGALFSAAYSERTVDQVGDSSGVYYYGNFAGGFCDPENADGACYGEDEPDGITVADLNSENYFVPRFPRSIYQRTDQDRLGLTGSLQWAPDDATEISLDALYSDLEVNRQEYYVQGILYQDQTGIIVRDAQFDGNTMVAANLDNVDLRTEHTIDDSTTKFTQFTLNGHHDFTDALRLTGTLGYSKSNFDNPIETTVQMDAFATQGYSFDATGGPGHLVVGYGPDVNDPDTWYVGPKITTASGETAGPEIRIRPSWVDFTEKVGNLDLRYAWTQAWTLNGGVQFKRFDYDSDVKRRMTEDVPTELPDGVTTADLASSFTGPDGVTWQLPNVAAFDRVYGIYSDTGDFKLYGAESSLARGQIRQVQEKDAGGYVQADFDSTLGNLPVRGNFGVRYVRTEQWSNGFVQSGDSYDLIEADRDYDNWLPALNVVVEPMQDLLLRFGAAKVMSRASLSSLSPNTSISTGDGTTTISRGNPELDPIQATTLDLSVEWYVGPGSILSAGFFYKDIDTYIQTLTLTNQTFEDTGLSEEALEGTGATTDDDFTISRPVNTSGGPLQGFELGVQQPLGVIANWLDGFGVLLNYTYVDSKIDYIIGGDATDRVKGPLLGLSKYGYNTTLYYEKNRLSARVSGAYRSKYTRSIPGPSGQDIYGTESTFNVDASASYNVSDSLTLSLEGINLTDEASSLYSDSSRRWQDYYKTGREFMLGFRYTY